MSTTDEMTRCVTALNCSTVADTVATVSSAATPDPELPGRAPPPPPPCRLEEEPLDRLDQTDPRHCCGSTLRNRSYTAYSVVQLYTKSAVMDLRNVNNVSVYLYCISTA